jgi:YVTN family beta-propeller protein
MIIAMALGLGVTALMPSLAQANGRAVLDRGFPPLVAPATRLAGSPAERAMTALVNPAEAGKTVKVGALPTGVAATNTTAYVTNAESDSVSVISLKTLTVTATVGVGSFPISVALNASGSMAYVTDFKGRSLSIVNTATHAVVHTVRVGTDPDGVVGIGGSIYVANLLSGTISVINPGTGTVTQTITLPGSPTPAPSGLAASADQSKLYVDDARNGRTDVIELTGPTPVLAGSTVVGPYPAYLAIAGTTGYVADAGQGASVPGAISQLNLANPADPILVGTAPVGLHPYGIATLPAVQDLLVSNSGDGTLSVVNAASGVVANTLHIGTTPDAVAVTPNQTTVLVTNEGDDTVSILHVNQPPANTVPGARTVASGGSLVFSTAHGDRISTADADAGTNPEQVMLSVAHGSLTLAQTTGLSFVSGANGSSAMVFTGTTADIDAALNGLTYAPAGGYAGKDTLAFSVDDQGNSGDISVPETTTSSVTITVTSVAPTAGPVSFTGAIGNTAFGVGTTPQGPSTTISGSVLSNSSAHGSGTLSAVAGTIATTRGGSVTLNANGSFTYEPPAGVTGNDTFSFTVTNGSGFTSSATATIAIAHRVWYVNDAAATNGSGTSTSPFDVLSAVTGPNGPTTSGDDIFLFGSSAPYGGSIALKTDQLLIGQSATLVVGGRTVSTGTGANPTITNTGGAGITLGEGDEVSGITVSGTHGAGITATSVDAFTLSSDDTIQNAGGDGLDITGGHGTVTAGASISGSSGHSVDITGRTGGTITLSGAVGDTGAGVSLVGNTGAEIDFTGGLVASTGTDTAFTATGGGTVDVTGSANSLTTTTGEALLLQNTSIGSRGLTFRSITAGGPGGGPGSGIDLENTGSGSLTVTGSGATAGSGGTIQHTTGDSGTVGAVVLIDVGGVSLSNMVVDDSADNGVYALDVPGLTLVGNQVSSDADYGVVDQWGNNLKDIPTPAPTTGDGVFDLAGNTMDDDVSAGAFLSSFSSGTFVGQFTGNTVTDSEGDGLDLYAYGGTTTAGVSDNTISDTTTGPFPNGGEAGVYATTFGDQSGASVPTLNVTITGNTIDFVRPDAGDGIDVYASDFIIPITGPSIPTTVCVNATGNTVDSQGVGNTNGSAVDMFTVNDGTSTFDYLGPSEDVGGSATNVGEDPGVESYFDSVNAFSANDGAGQAMLAWQEQDGYTHVSACPAPPGAASASADSTFRARTGAAESPARAHTATTTATATAPSSLTATAVTREHAVPARFLTRLTAWQRMNARLRAGAERHHDARSRRAR